MAKARKQAIVDEFLRNRSYMSPSGFTARIVVEYCIEHNLTFKVVRNAATNAHKAYYVVKLGA